MSTPYTESLTKAAQCADLLAGDVREAYQSANAANAVVALALRNILSHVETIKARLAELDALAAQNIGGQP